MLVFLHLLRLEHGSGITQIPNSSKNTLHPMVNSKCLNSLTSQNHFHINAHSSQVSKTFSSSTNSLKTSCSFQKNAKRSLVEKQVGLLLLTNDMHIQEKRSCTQTRPNSLANAKHAASEFRKPRLKFLSINIITKYFAPPCKVQKTTKNISFPDVIRPFCSKSRAVHKNNIVVTKFHMPYQVVRGT